MPILMSILMSECTPMPESQSSSWPEFLSESLHEHLSMAKPILRLKVRVAMSCVRLEPMCLGVLGDDLVKVVLSAKAPS